MIDVREIARDFVVPYFRVRKSFFDTAWELISTRYEETPPAPISARDLRQLSRPLGIVGDEKQEAVLAVLIFMDVSRKALSLTNSEELIATLKAAAENYQAHERMTRDLLEHVKKLTVQKIPTDREVPIKKTEYARMWSNDTTADGKTIDKYTVDKLVNRKADGDIFIIDKGEFQSDSYGEVYFTCGAGAKRKCEQAGLQPLEYRILVTALKGKGIAGNAVTLAKTCWLDPAVAADLQSSNPDDRERAFSRIRQATTRLSALLYEKFRVELKTFKKGKYKLAPVPTFCLIEVLSR